MINFGIKTTEANREAFKKLCVDGKIAHDVLTELLAGVAKAPPSGSGSADAITNNRLAADYEKRIAELKAELATAQETLSNREEKITTLETLTQELESKPTGVILPSNSFIYNPGQRKEAIQRVIAYLIKKGKMQRQSHEVMLQKFTDGAVDYYTKNAFDL